MWPHFAWSVRAPRVSPDDLVVSSAKLRPSTFIFPVLESFSLKMELPIDPEVRGRIFAFAVHFDSSTSHTAGETVKWLKANKIKCIPAEKWTPNSPGSVADGLFRERVPEISHQKEPLQDIRGHDSLRERRMVKYSPRNVSKSFILVI